MRFLDIIEKKKTHQELTKSEIQFWIDGLINNNIPAYQTTALLMAIVLNGMSERETADLTSAMAMSGDKLDLLDINGVKIDKHSTRGVGDKTSLILIPLLASFGLILPKMSGRGLGHTGGTIDKLESISGFNPNISQKRFIQQLKEIGLGIISQTDSLVPADKELYALRDATSTVDSIPLIASSIMSKKIASGADTIFIDVKYGKGAFMNKLEDARKLAKSMISIGKHLNKNTIAVISTMDQPLGYNIGNSLEIKEAVETLKGNGPRDLKELVYKSALIILMEANIVTDENQGIKLIEEKIHSNLAFEKFIEMIKAQDGDINQILDLEKLPKAKYIEEIKSEKSGFIKSIYTKEIATLTMLLGAGRAKKSDIIQHEVGLELPIKVGDYVNKGDLICIAHSNKILDSLWKNKLLNSIKYIDEKTDKIKVIEEIVK